VMHSVDGSFRGVPFLVCLAVVFFLLLRAVMNSPNDRVLLLQCIAWGIFAAMAMAHRFTNTPDWIMPFGMIFFIFFVVLTGYFAPLNWLRCRRRAR
jgi:hypothetical protein